MEQQNQKPTYDNTTYQFYLAKNLVHSLGYRDAVDVCFRNNWDDTMKLIRSDEFTRDRH
ncbi:MAG: hypothetical protein HON14_12050 [Rhodospirillaceae bacterium]|nr:hypothetical protein [Rhodospirillaceae bacterium]MBT4939860.1 hypothetical protein [Rhodospirillaceae bacterium]MBT7267335.1 hypothetical protein [Rhodospirillaceae bacterium]